MFEQEGTSIPLPFLVVLIAWITIIFVSFGLLAPPNGTVIATPFVCALSVAWAIFLIRLSDSNHEILVVKKRGRALTQAYASAWSHISSALTS